MMLLDQDVPEKPPSSILHSLHILTTQVKSTIFPKKYNDNSIAASSAPAAKSEKI